MPSTKTPAAPLVWINGFPGVGKLTVATEVAARIPDAILIDNHKMIDPVAAKFSRDHPEYQSERRKVRQATFQSIVQSQQNRERVVIFTDFQTTDEVGTKVAREYKEAAQKAERSFIPIYLTCTMSRNLERIALPSRVEKGTTKLIDSEVLRDIRTLGPDPFRFQEQEGLEVDTSYDSAAKVASVIITHLQKIAILK